MIDNYELKNECIICLESNDTNNPILKLKTFKKRCDCDSNVHKLCIEKWYNYNAICPVCRLSINTSTSDEQLLPLHNSSENTLHSNDRCNSATIFNCCCYLFVCFIIGIFTHFNSIKFHSHK